MVLGKIEKGEKTRRAKLDGCRLRDPCLSAKLPHLKQSYLGQNGPIGLSEPLVGLDAGDYRVSKKRQYRAIFRTSNAQFTSVERGRGHQSISRR